MKIQMQISRFSCALLFGLLTVQAFPQTEDPGGGRQRKPAVAGSFYPASGPALESTLEQLFREAGAPEFPGTPQCLIVPHAGYVFSGAVAASGYLSIPPDARFSNIFIIASSHTMQFDGASVYTAGDYLTPLGTVPVNRDIAWKLAEEHSFIRFRPEAHEREHSIEVQLPFIQYHLEHLPPVVPIVIGSSSLSAARDLASALHPYFTPGNLFIISADFSHYPAYDEAVRIDGLTGEAILKNDPEIFYRSLQKSSRESVLNLVTPCCSWSAVLTLLYISSHSPGMKFSQVLYRNSGDVPAGAKDRVVGYWAITGHRTPVDQAALYVYEAIVFGEEDPE